MRDACARQLISFFAGTALLVNVAGTHQVDGRLTTTVQGFCGGWVSFRVAILSSLRVRQTKGIFKGSNTVSRDYSFNQELKVWETAENDARENLN